MYEQLGGRAHGEPLMQDESDHAVVVRAFMEAAAGLPTEGIIQTFEAGFAALWARASQTLGDVTLTAIMDRVLATVAERHPLVAALELDAGGIRGMRLRESAAMFGRDQARDGLGVVLVEFLRVLGKLTAEILTPVLHAELLRLRHERDAADGSDR